MERRVIASNGTIVVDWEPVIVHGQPISEQPVPWSQRLVDIFKVLRAYRDDLTVAVALIHDDGSRTEFRLTP